MTKFYIIHLSDLHIIKPLTSTLKNLIKSIASNKALHNSNVFIIITGDIINQANYKNYKQTVISFFTKLKEALDENSICVLDIVIVPGNHDKVINVEQKICSILQHSHRKFPLDKNKDQDNNQNHLPTESEMMDFQNKAFSDYLGICNEIFKIFNIHVSNKRSIKSYDKTFGIDFCKIDDFNISFIRLNTAMTSYGAPNDSEKYQLLLGDLQTSQILEKYRKLRDGFNPSEGSLTFCLAHHPSSYLEPHESEKLNKILISEDGLNVDFFLSGHIHDGSLNNLSNHNRSMISLETGIGWPDNVDATTNSFHKNHRYAIYCFDEWKNTFYSMMYKTNNSNEFEFDTDYLITDEEKKTGKIYNPLKTRDYAFIPLNNYNDLEMQNLFIDRNNINDLKFLFNTTKNFNNACNDLIQAYLLRYGDKLLINEKTHEKTFDFLSKKIKNFVKQKNESVFETINNILADLMKEEDLHDEKLINEHFLAYLKHISDFFISYYKEYFDDDAEYRAVFRIYKQHEDYEDNNKIGKESITNDFYEPICESPNETTPRVLESGTVNNTSGKSRRYKYKDSLIEYSYNNKHSMIYSINPDKNYFKPDNWDDFMVIIPETSEISYFNDNRKRITRAPLCFIFSLRIKNDSKDKVEYNKKLKRVSNKLYLLQFTEIENVLTSAIQNFLAIFPVDLNKFIKYEFNRKEIENAE